MSAYIESFPTVQFALTMKSAGISVFAQLIRLLPMADFEGLASRHTKSFCNSRKFTARDYFTAILFGQLSGATSLRELVLGLEAAGGKMFHTGSKAMKLSTLAYNNNIANPRLFRDFYYQFLHRVQNEIGLDLDPRFTQPLYSLDSTTITLGCQLYSWANYKRERAGIKLHVALSNETEMPAVTVVSVAKKADVKWAKAVIMQLPFCCTVVMDRGYNDYALFMWLNERGTTFVTRLKKNALHTPFMKNEISRSKTWGDYRIRFTSKDAQKACGQMQWRVVQWFDEESNRWFEFLTNDLKIPAEVVAELYRQRWKVELFFKKLKQNIVVKSFYGTTANAVHSQIWIALTATLLLELVRRRSTHSWSYKTLAWVIRQNLWGYQNLNEILSREKICEETKVATTLAQLSLDL